MEIMILKPRPDYERFVDGTRPRLPDQWYFLHAVKDFSHLIFMKSADIFDLPAEVVEVEFNNGDFHERIFTFRLKRVTFSEGKPQSTVTAEYFFAHDNFKASSLNQAFPGDRLTEDQINIVMANLKASLTKAGLL